VKAKLNDHLASTLLPHYLAKFERLMVIFNTFVQFKSCPIKQNHLFTLETFFVYETDISELTVYSTQQANSQKEVTKDLHTR